MNKKEIYFCIDYWSKHYYFPLDYGLDVTNYEDTENAIKNNIPIIVTNSMAHLSFDLIDLGYDIYLCYKDKRVKIEPHMDLTGIGEPCKDLRFGHNIFKLFKAGIFNKLLGINN